jgi:hypothetical protein
MLTLLVLTLMLQAVRHILPPFLMDPGTHVTTLILYQHSEFGCQTISFESICSQLTRNILFNCYQLFHFVLKIHLQNIILIVLVLVLVPIIIIPTSQIYLQPIANIPSQA